MDKPTLKERLRYWFDNQIARGTGSMILLLFIATILIVGISTIIICLIDPQSSWHIIMWNNTATALNKWMPSIEEEDIVWATYIINALVAIAGLFITSILIGIISTGIESRLFLLKGGRRTILEKDHIIILGAEDAGLFLEEIKAFAGEETCHVVIADELEDDEFNEIAALQKKLPKNVKLHVRNMDICDMDSIRLCSIPDARAVIINARNDEKAIQSMMAVSAILRECPNAKTAVVVGLSSDRRMLPRDTVDPRIVQIQVRKTLARFLVRFSSCKGLADAVVDFMKFSKNQLHVGEIPELCGKSFGAVLARSTGAIPIGIRRGDEHILVPPFDMIIEQGDKILFFGAKEKRLVAEDAEITELPNGGAELKARSQTVVYIGSHLMLRRVIGYMPPRIKTVVLVPRKKEEAEFLSAVAADMDNDARHVKLADIDPFEEPQLLQVIRNADQVVLVLGDDEGMDTTETDNVVLLHKIKSLCKKEKLKCNTNMMMQGHSWSAMDYSDANITIYNLKEMQVKILLKSVLQPEAQRLFAEIMEQDRHELLMKGIAELGFESKDYSIGELRRRCMQQGSILLGYVTPAENQTKTVMNPVLECHVALTEEDSLIIIK